MNSSFFSDLLASIADRGRGLLGRKDLESLAVESVSGVLDLCNALLSGRGEASGVAIARELLASYENMKPTERMTFFRCLASDFGPDPDRISKAVERWRSDPGEATASDIHFLSEPRRQEFFRRLNRAPGGTFALVRMREDLLSFKQEDSRLASVDRCLAHLFLSWFNRGFLVLRRIDWSTPANILEKIIRYEAVHEIRDWDDLRRRIDPPDRRCYAFFHPALIDEPLIFVEVAITEEMPAAISPLLAEAREIVRVDKAKTAVFYSISNCQKGLAGVSFGNFLIKQVVEDLRRELPQLEKYVTLSPVPRFVNWLKSSGASLSSDERNLVAELDELAWPSESGSHELRQAIERLAARYFLEAKTDDGRPIDPVARFHLGNGARLERINWKGDMSAKAIREGAGLMVNYLYDLEDIERNHEAYANQHQIVASSAVRRMLRIAPGSSRRSSLASP
jgi:malonyl-CoA decarboxylase